MREKAKGRPPRPPSDELFLLPRSARVVATYFINQLLLLLLDYLRFHDQGSWIEEAIFMGNMHILEIVYLYVRIRTGNTKQNFEI